MQLKNNAVELIVRENLVRAKNIHSKLNMGSEPAAYAFIISGLEIIFNQVFKEENLLKIITDGGNDLSIDAVYIDKEYINIFDFKNTKNQCVKKDLLAFKKNFEEYILKQPKSYKNLNPQIVSRVKEIHSKRNSKKKIRLFFVRSKDFTEPKYLTEIRAEFLKLHTGLEVFYHNQDSLITCMTENENYADECTFCLESKDDKFFFDVKDAFIKVRVSELLKFMEDAERGGKNIFSKNIRQDLRKRNFSERIVETLKNEPEKFHIYHNGITITTVGNIEINKTTEITLKNPQVVNGAQTLEALKKNFTKNDILAKKSKILCKIVSADSFYAAKICEAANTQTPVTTADLRANDEVQFLLEKVIDRLGEYKYLRKSGMPAPKKLSGIKLTEFMQWSYSALFGKPADAKNRKKYIFSLLPEKKYESSLYEKIEKRLYLISKEDLKLLCDVGVSVKNFSYKTKDKAQKSFIRHVNMHIIAGLYLLKSTKASDTERIIHFLTKYYKSELLSDSNLNENKVFTKSEKAWDKLKVHLKN